MIDPHDLEQEAQGLDRGIEFRSVDDPEDRIDLCLREKGFGTIIPGCSISITDVVGVGGDGAIGGGHCGISGLVFTEGEGTVDSGQECREKLRSELDRDQGMVFLLLLLLHHRPEAMMPSTILLLTMMLLLLLLLLGVSFSITPASLLLSPFLGFGTSLLKTMQLLCLFRSLGCEMDLEEMHVESDESTTQFTILTTDEEELIQEDDPVVLWRR